MNAHPPAYLSTTKLPESYLPTYKATNAHGYIVCTLPPEVCDRLPPYS